MTSQRQREMYDMGRWARPPEPWPADAERWARFYVGVFDRIATLRATEGFNGERTSWRTFPTSTVTPTPNRTTRVTRRDGPIAESENGCGAADCDVDWLFSMPPDGPERDAWLARIRAELGVESALPMELAS